jgi:hypothetical protein
MPRYFPIDTGLDGIAGDLVRVDWTANHLSADFALAGDRVVRVRFKGTTIVRLLDEMPLSTETDLSESEGLVPGGFAYRVEGATFAATQSQVWLDLHKPVSHFEFITGWGCMDVLCPHAPTFEVVDASDMTTLSS